MRTRELRAQPFPGGPRWWRSAFTTCIYASAVVTAASLVGFLTSGADILRQIGQLAIATSITITGIEDVWHSKGAFRRSMGMLLLIIGPLLILLNLGIL